MRSITIVLLFFIITAVAVIAGSSTSDGCGEFPLRGPLSIFRDDFSFFHTGGIDGLSVPKARCGCKVKLLNQGEESFQWRLKVLREAEQSIRIQTYIFTGDEMGKKVADKLKKARKAGVEVRLIVDAYTKFRPNDRKMYADLELKGISVMGFEPAYLLGVVDNRILDVQDVNKRFHEKYWVIDDKIAFLGGTNIANEYARYGDDPMDKWRDQDVMILGPLVADVAGAFDQNYEYFMKRRLNRLPVNQPALWAALWWKISGMMPPAEAPAEEPLAAEAKRYTDENAAVRFIRHRPREDEDYIYQAYLHLIREAREKIILENAYFVPRRALSSALIEAAGRGVDITVVTNSMATNDVTGMQPLSRYSYLPLIAAGIKIYEWRGDHPGFGSLHAKCAVFDGMVSVIGSFNLDPRSIRLNSENVVVIASEKTAAGLAAQIEGVDIGNSDRIEVEQAKKWREPEGMSDKFKVQFGMALEDWY